VNVTADIVTQFCPAFPQHFLESFDLLRGALLEPFPGKIPYCRGLQDYSLIAQTALFEYSDEKDAVDIVDAFTLIENKSSRLGTGAASEEDVLICTVPITGAIWAAFFSIVDRNLSVVYTYNKQDRSHSSIGDGRPDECVYIKDFLVFKAEHTMNDVNVAVGELTGKMQSYNVMDYGPDICFLPTVAAGGVEIEFGLIDVRTNAYNIIRRYDIRSHKQRGECLVTSLNYFRLLRTMVPVVPARANPVWGYSRGNKNIVYGTNAVKKTLTGGETCPNELYTLLASGSVPRAVQVIRKRRHLEISPVGWCISKEGYEVRTKQELRTAIAHVLEALVYLHSRGFVHRDVRWSNVIQLKSPTPSFCLIDFELACQSGEPMTLQNYIHSWVVDSGNPYCACHDVWLVSCMVENWFSAKGLPVDSGVNDFTELCRSSSITAAEALTRWEAIQLIA
jgi:hypothetical protein